MDKTWWKLGSLLSNRQFQWYALKNKSLSVIHECIYDFKLNFEKGVHRLLHST